ncbi:unnamed protein product, partial [Prorocentrum cordatum]
AAASAAGRRWAPRVGAPRRGSSAGGPGAAGRAESLRGAAVVAGLGSAWVRSGGALRGPRGRAGDGGPRRAALAAVGGKPDRTTLYTKAGPDGSSLGDCPFSHSVQMALKLKGVDYDVVPCTADSKPQWLVEEVGGKMPCVCHQGVAHVETSEILAWIDSEFSGPSLEVPERLKKVADGFFPALASFTKNTDPSKDDSLRLDLQIAFTRLRNHMHMQRTKFLCGDEPTLLDCDLLPKLYVFEQATAKLKGYGFDDFPEFDEVLQYPSGRRLPVLPPRVGRLASGSLAGAAPISSACREEGRPRDLRLSKNHDGRPLAIFGLWDPPPGLGTARK